MTAYTTPTSMSSGNTLTAAQVNSYRTGLEAVAKPPSIQAYNSAAQSIPNAGWNSKTLNATFSAVDLSLASNVITISESGLFVVVGNWAWVGNATGTRGARIFVNGVASQDAFFTPGGTTPNVHSFTFLQGFTAGDLVRFDAYQDSGGSLNLSAVSRVAIVQISR